MPFELVGLFFRGVVVNTHLFSFSVLTMDNITKAWSNLSLNDGEENRFTLKNSSRSSEFFIAAKFLTKRALNMEAVGRTFMQLWRSTGGFKIRSVDDHIVLFVFSNQADVERNILSKPWCFDKHLVVMKRYDNDVPLRELKFSSSTFWVQVHDMPIRYMTKEVAEELCDTIGEVSRSTRGVDEEGGEFMRVRVTLDISLPLCQGRLVTIFIFAGD